uniref:butyrophilin-like protein 2 n=1 Tax=Monopterus albus TaxID=43700 RepID=UPI0009B2F7D4|nr:butyrophilin-like protein 2 [Monopterus albus]
MFRLGTFLFITATLYSAIFASDVRELKVNPGDTVTLPCLDPGHTTLQMLQWSRPDQLSHGYVYFYRDGHLLERYQHSSYHGRVEVKDLGMKDGDFSLILRNVSINDTGKYECRIGRGTSGRRKRHDPVLLSTINLKVDDSGHTDGKTWDGADMEGRAKDGGKSETGLRNGQGHVRPLVSLSVTVIVVVGLIFM